MGSDIYNIYRYYIFKPLILAVRDIYAPSRIGSASKSVGQNIFYILNLSCNVHKIVKASTKSSIFNRKPSVEVA